MSTKIVTIVSLGMMLLGYGCTRCTNYECERVVYASDVNRWLAQYDANISYDDGVWYADDTPIGVSPLEDSDVCLV